ncbi:unnamed protein product [Calypogeia fissa]
MTFIPKVFEVQGLVSVAYLWDEASLLPPGAELRAKTRAKLVSIMPEFGGFWYEGCKCYNAEARRYCRKPVGPRQGLFKPEDERKWHFHPCERGDIQFWKFRIGVDDTYSKLEGVIWQAAGYLLGDHPDSPYWPWTFQKHFPTEKSQTKYFDALIESETWFIFDVVYKRNEDLGDFTFTYVKNASKGPNIPMYPTPTGHMKACDPPLFPTSVLQMDPDSKLKKHSTCGSEKAHPDGGCILEAPSPPSTPDSSTKLDWLQDEFEALNVQGTRDTSESCSRHDVEGRIRQWKTQGLEEAIESLKFSIQAVEEMKNKLVKELRQLQEMAYVQ